MAAQQRVTPTPQRAPSVNSPGVVTSSGVAPEAKTVDVPSGSSDSGAGANYVLGAGDLLSLSVADLEDFTEKSFRIDLSGDINLPLAGRIHAAGLTVDAFEGEVNKRLGKLLKSPDAVVTVTEFHSQPVSILGAVNTPGVRQVGGQKKLFEIISLAGGLRSDAGDTVEITRDSKWGVIPLPNARMDSTGRYSTASVKVKSIMNATNPVENITIMPNDVISVPKGDLVYAVGSINRPGGFLLGENETLTTLQVVSLAEGVSKTAASDKAKILRSVPGSTNREEIAVNIKQLMAGKASDIPLRANDILFIPNSGAKSASYRTLEAVIQTATGLAIYGR
jgi:polysaccharide export outer membrane protein